MLGILCVSFVGMTPLTATARPPGRIAELKRCRSDERDCRKRCRADPPGKPRRHCRRLCKRLGRDCRRKARRGKRVRWGRLARCRGERRQCTMSCWKERARADRPACVQVCQRAYGDCKKRR